MYNPIAFSVADPVALRDAVRSFGAAEFITCGAHGLEASVLPLLIDDSATRLTGHLARANDQWRHLSDGAAVLVTWRGPDSYVSPSYYPSKAEHGKVVPTWNYTTVQARGTLTIHDDPVWVAELVRALTDVHEADFDTPWSVDDPPAGFIDSLTRAIVGIEVNITSIEGKWKLSQNRPAADVAGVITGLAHHRPATAEGRIAHEMAIGL